jgi:hypothetical protein
MVSHVRSEKLRQELKDLETCADAELKDRWQSLYGTRPPQKIHRSLLIAAVAHRMQENALGALKPSVRRHLMQATKNPATARLSPYYPSLRPRVEARPGDSSPAFGFNSGKFLADWLETVKPTMRPRTYESYELHVRHHLTRAIGTVRLSSLRPDHIRSLLKRKLAERPVA